MNEFEKVIKPEFTGDEDEVHRILFLGLQDSPRHGFTGGVLEISGSELKEHVFDKVIVEIKNLVNHQIATTSKPIKAVLLAGGFGQSSYLKEQLKSMPSVELKGIQIQHIKDR